MDWAANCITFIVLVPILLVTAGMAIKSWAERGPIC